MPEDDITELNDRYRETLGEQADLRRRGYELLEAEDAFPPLDTDALSAVCRNHAARFDGRLLLFGASDFGHPAAFVPDRGAETIEGADRAAVLDGLHEEAGKWQGSHDGLRELREAAFAADPNLHKGFAAHVTDDGVEYDLEGGVDEAYNFVTIRQVVGLVDWLTNSFQADALTVRY